MSEYVAIEDGRPHLPIESNFVHAGFHDPRCSAHGVIRRPPSQMFKRGIDVLDCTIDVGDHHAVGGLLQRARQLVHLQFVVFPIGDVLPDNKQMKLIIK